MNVLVLSILLTLSSAVESAEIGWGRYMGGLPITAPVPTTFEISIIVPSVRQLPVSFTRRPGDVLPPVVSDDKLMQSPPSVGVNGKK